MNEGRKSWREGLEKGEERRGELSVLLYQSEP